MSSSVATKASLAVFKNLYTYAPLRAEDKAPMWGRAIVPVRPSAAHFFAFVLASRSAAAGSHCLAPRTEGTWL